MNLQLPPGSVLNENELSEILQVSRTPVHEAIIKLKAEYLVTVYPQSASKVSLIDLEILKEGLFLRTTVEPAILNQIAGKITMEELRPLKQNLENQLNAIESQEPIDTFFHLDDDFHHIMYNLANKPKTWYTVKSICSHYDRARYIDAIKSKADLKMFYNEHKNIYHLIALGISPEYDIENFYSKHLRTFLRNFENVMEQYSDYFLN